jgi:hypothetical protein
MYKKALLAGDKARDILEKVLKGKEGDSYSIAVSWSENGAICLRVEIEQSLAHKVIDKIPDKINEIPVVMKYVPPKSVSFDI